MINKIKLLTATAVLSLLTACGGGGGSGAVVAPVSAIPLQIAMKNIYGTSWTASGAISGYQTALSNSCNGGNGGFCNTPITGNFTRTTTLNGFSAITNYAQTFASQGINTTYTTTFASDYSTISFGSCSLNLPSMVNVGYTQVSSCANLTITASTDPTMVIMTINNSAGTEIYNVGTNGTAGPVRLIRTGKLIPAWTLVDFSINLNY
jgi:hypothetical protein